MTLTRIAGAMGITAFTGLSIENLYRFHLRHQAVEAIKVNKLITSLEWNLTTNQPVTKFVAPYGIVKNGEYVFQPGSTLVSEEGTKWTAAQKNVNISMFQPLMTYLEWESSRNAIYFWRKPKDSYKPFNEAINDWKMEEKAASQLGHTVNLRPNFLISVEQRKVIEYYTEVALLALALGVSMSRIFYQGPTRSPPKGPFYYPDSVEPNGGIAFLDTSLKSSVKTPIGSFEDRTKEPVPQILSDRILKHFTFEKINPQLCKKCYKGDRDDIHVKKVNTASSGQEIPPPMLVHGKLPHEKGQETWQAVRDYVFQRVNQRLKEIVK